MIGDEIVKAWNEEIHLANYVDESYRNGIDISLIKNTLDLINRLQADKEALIAGQETLQKYISSQNSEISRLSLLAKLGEKRANDYRVMRDRALKAESEIERLKKLLAEADTSYNKCAKRFYKEGVKDFANRLKDEMSIWSFDFTYYTDRAEANDNIDNLVKEMVGDTK